MKSLPVKFLRILIEIKKLFRSCAGRERSVSSPTIQAMDIHLLARQLDAAIQGLTYWKEQRRLLGELTSHRTDWCVLSHTNLVKNYSELLAERIDELIPTHQLYVDLLESAE